MKLHLLLFFILAAPVLSRFLSSESEPAAPAPASEIVAPKTEIKSVNPVVPVKPSSPPTHVAPCSTATTSPASLIFTLM